MNDNIEIRNRIDKACDLLGMSKAKFCEYLEISYDKLKQIYTGKSKFMWPESKKMKELGISPEWLIDGDGSPYADNSAGEALSWRGNEPERIPMAVFENPPEYIIDEIAERAAEKAYEKGRRQGHTEMLEILERLKQQAQDGTGDVVPLYAAAGRLKKKKKD